MPQSLPIFRRFITSLARSPGQVAPETGVQLRGVLTRFLSILKHAQKRESEAALLCEKNTILATTILLSSAAPALEAGDPLLKRFVDEIGECLENRMTSKVAANCCRTILLLPSKGSAESAMASHLLPILVSFLTNPSDVEGLDESRTIIAHALTSFIPTLAQTQQKQTAMALVIPTLLARASKEGADTYKETAARLLELAGADQTAFKGVVGGLSAEQRSFMESVIKAGSTGAQGKGREALRRDDTGEPTIALKMDFGG